MELFLFVGRISDVFLFLWQVKRARFLNLLAAMQVCTNRNDVLLVPSSANKILNFVRTDSLPVPYFLTTFHTQFCRARADLSIARAHYQSPPSGNSKKLIAARAIDAPNYIAHFFCDTRYDFLVLKFVYLLNSCG